MSQLLAPFVQMRLVDVADILLVTAIVYTGLVWLRRTQAWLVAAGMLILGAFYVVARVLELQLTAWIFQGFFAIFLVMIVVIFQEELRQMFELTDFPEVPPDVAKLDESFKAGRAGQEK